MLRKFGSHLRDQWAGFLSLFLVLAGGTAYAANTVLTGDIKDNEVYSTDVRNDTLPWGGLTSIDLRPGSVGSSEVGAESLTGADIANQSGVDTCVLSTRLGQLCARGENSARLWHNALQHCANIDLRLPTLGEALELAQTHDIPNVDQNEPFWTDEFYDNGRSEITWVVEDDGSHYAVDIESNGVETVCVTTPTN